MKNVDGAFYKFLRLRLNLSQREVAEKAGLKQANIAKFENDYISVLSNMSRKLLDFYGVPTESMEAVLESDMYKDFIYKDKSEKLLFKLRNCLGTYRTEHDLEKLMLLENYINLLEKRDDTFFRVLRYLDSHRDSNDSEKVMLLESYIDLLEKLDNKI